MRTHLVKVLAPQFELLAHIQQREEHLHVQTFIPQPAIERLDIAILDWAAGPDEI
jgi:hypothetical protein